VRIPGGDLAPARRRRYGGSYGRRRRRRNLRLAVALLLVVAGAGGVYALRRDDTAAPARLEAKPSASPCVKATAPPASQPAAVPQPQQVRLVLLNGTPRSGLAKTVGDQLAAAGFSITAQGNAPQSVVGDSVVQYGRGALPAGTLVTRWVQGSHLAADAKLPAGAVQLVLGSGFARLSTPAEVASAAKAVPTTPATSVSACPS
jgi:hypothetical protein